MAKFEAAWSGAWPHLCSGEWTLFKDGVNVSRLIPEEKRYSPMDTAGTYTQQTLSENLDTECNEYEDGLEVQQWILENPWIETICDTEEEKIDLFYEISVSDWRHGSCGGCCI